MRFILQKQGKQILAGMLAFFLLFYSCVGIVAAEGKCEHKETELVGKIKATCEETGYTGDRVCSECGETLKYGEMIPKLEHKIADYECTECGKKFGAIKFVMHSEKQPAEGDTFQIDVVLEKNPGIAALKIEYEYDASRLKLIDVEDKKVLKGYKESTAGELVWEKENRKEDSFDTGVIATLTVQALDDSYGMNEISFLRVKATDRTDEEETFTLLEGVSFSVACVHRWNQGIVTKQPTCKENGVKLYTCEKDSTHTWEEKIPKLGHKWDEGVVKEDASCEKEGLLIYTCLNDSSHTMQEKLPKLEHDYQIIDYKKPTTEEDGYEKYQCSRCEDEYEVILPKTGTDTEVKFEYDDGSGATSDKITFYVGYFGMGFVKKTTLSLSDIQNNCQMITQKFSYINRRPRVVYDVATGASIRDVLQLAGVDMASAQSYQLGTEDSAGNFYNAQEITNSLLYSNRFFYPKLSKYFQEDGTFSNRLMAASGAQVVEPMLAIWDSWVTYGIGQEFELSEHASHMKSGNCFRLLYGQTTIDEVRAVDSAKWINAIYVRYTGEPALDAGDDLDLSISSDHVLSANVSTVDEALTNELKNYVRWSSSDESVIKVDAVTGKVTVVGEGKATITAMIDADGVHTSDTLEINVTADDEDENLQGGGSGNGNGTGEGDGNGAGTGGDGSGNGSGAESGSGAENGNGSDLGSGEGTEKGEGSNTTPEQIEESVKKEETKGTETEEENDQLIQVIEETEEVKLGKSISMLKLNLGEEVGGNQSGGKSGGGLSGEILLNLQTQTLWRGTVIFAAIMLLAGGATMYRKYQLEI